MDRLALPDDRREACRACGSEKREYLTECAHCEKAICSRCMVVDTMDCGTGPASAELCRSCALKTINYDLALLVPSCTCEWPAWSHYGQQFVLSEEMACK